jgi:hypothetical protein
MGRFLQPSRYTPVANSSHIALATSQHHLSLLHRRLDLLRARREQLTATIASLRPVYGSATSNIITHKNHTDFSHSTAAHDEALTLLWGAVSHMSRGEPYLASSHATTAESLNDLAPLLEDLVAVARFSDVSSTPLFHHPSDVVSSTGPVHSAERFPLAGMASSSPASQQLTRDLPGYCMVSSQHS